MQGNPEGNPFLEMGIDVDKNKAPNLIPGLEKYDLTKQLSPEEMSSILGDIKDFSIQSAEKHIEFMERTDKFDVEHLERLKEKRVKAKKGQPFVEAIDEHMHEISLARDAIKKNLEERIEEKYQLKRMKIDRMRDKELQRVRAVIAQGDEKQQMNTAEQELERVKREIEEMKMKRQAPS